MSDSKKTDSLSLTDLSARIVAECENDAPDAATLLGWVQDVAALAGTGREADQQLRDQTFLVAEQKFVDLHDVPSLVKLLAVKARWTGNRPLYGTECATVLASATKDRLVLAKIASADFGKRRPLESLDRLTFLLALKPGTAVADRRWGYGTVKREDDFYRNAEVVFDRDGAPRMIGFGFAPDSLSIIPPTHLLAVRHADEAAFAKRCAEKPGEVVRLALESYGDMTVAKLQSLLEDLALPKGTEWKKFWAEARRQLAGDRAVVVPPATKKNAPVELLREGGRDSGAKDAGAAARLAACRDPKEVLEMAAALLRDPGAEQFAPELRAAFGERLAYVMKCAVADRRLGNRAKFQAILLALQSGAKTLPVSFPGGAASRNLLLDEFEFAAPDSDEVDLAATAARPDLLLDAAKTLPATQIDPLLEKLPLDTDAAMAERLARIVPLMPSALVDHLAPRLLLGSGAEAFRAMLLDQFKQDHVYNPDAEAQNEFEDADAADDAADADGLPKADGLSLALLRWVCHAQATEKCGKALRSIVSPFAVASLASVALGFPAEKENLRMRNDLKKLFVAGRRSTDPQTKGIEVDEGCKWLVPLMEEMSPEERAAVFLRVQAVDGAWEPLKKRNLVANLLAKWPELGANVPKERPAAAKGFFVENATSTRTYREREAQYRHLMDVEMPQNRKDIEFAKGFGDLSENFEYESARNKERELVARQAKLEEELGRVSAFDFATVEQNGLVGLGSRVVVEMPDGSEKVFSILGEWDSEPSLGILSCSTPLARALLDCREGDSVELPAENEEGTVEGVVKSVGALSDDILAWSRG
ncbi:MAG: GreA/GreB family elongation factor [Kiritimatiellae bacterium]|nr:GreA/GreB family elongation factor [Kiritimatiellia bacterium]